MSMRPADLALALLIMVIWALNLVISKIGLAELPPLLFVTMRFALAALLLAPFVKVPTRQQMKPIFFVAVTMGLLHFSLMFTGLNGIDPATAAIAINLQVPFSAALAMIFFNDRLGWRRAAGMTIAILGVGIVAGEPRLAGQLVPLGLVIAAVMMWAIAMIQIKKIVGIDGMQLNAWVSIFAAPMVLITSLVAEDGQWAALATASWRGYGAVFYNSAAVFIFSYGLWYYLLRRYPVNVTMPLTLMVPVFAVIFSVLLVDNPLTVPMVIGGLVTLAGVAIIVFHRPLPREMVRAKTE
ncbi:MAG: DMT family transporter [Alphaproteobacteria bacterium]